MLCLVVMELLRLEKSYRFGSTRAIAARVNFVYDLISRVTLTPLSPFNYISTDLSNILTPPS